MSEELKKKNLMVSLGLVEAFVEMKVINEEVEKQEEVVVNFSNEIKASKRKKRASILSEMDKKLYKETREVEHERALKKNFVKSTEI